MNAVIPPTTAASLRPSYVLGVEAGETIIRAGVYTESLRLVGKTKFSTKVERGAEAVTSRIARCIFYAADECDLPMAQIRSVGIGIPGTVNTEAGMVIRSSALGWSDVPLQSALERELGRPVAIGNCHNLAALGIYAHELPVAPRSFAGLFLGSQVSGGLIEGGHFKDPREYGLTGVPGELEQNIFSSVSHPLFQRFRSRDFRKALRKGHGEVREFLLQIARKAGEVAAEITQRFQPETVAFGGGVMDELREEILRCALDTARERLGGELAGRTTVVTSTLGDLAAITGAAVLAARTGQPTPPESVALDAVH